MSLRLASAITAVLTVLALVAPAVAAPDLYAGQPSSEVRSERIRMLPVEVAPGPAPEVDARSDLGTPDAGPADDLAPDDLATPAEPGPVPSSSATPDPDLAPAADPDTSPTSDPTVSPGPTPAASPSPTPSPVPEADPPPAATSAPAPASSPGDDPVPAAVADHDAPVHVHADADREDGLGPDAMDGDDVVTQSAVVPLDEVMLVGATWTSEARVEVRSGQAGEWSAWVPLVRDMEHAPDPGSAELEEAPKGVSEPVFVGGADEVQFRSDDLDEVRASFVEVVGGEGVAWTPNATNSAAADAAPSVRSRRDWGADESMRDGRVGYSSTGTVRFSVVHHVGGGTWGAGEIASGCARSDDWIRSIYAYHTQSRGWWDIGYNFIVDPCGTIWEGRAGGIDEPVDGAHAGGFNDGSVGVLALGTYSGSNPDPVTSALVNNIERVIAWKLELDQVEPGGMTSEVSGGGTARWPEGTRVSLPVLSAHQVSNTTTCPGDALMSRLFTGSNASGRPRTPYVDDVRDRITFLPNGFYPTEIPVGGSYVPLAGDFTGDGREDVLWYGRGHASDSLWTARADQEFTSSPLSVTGVYRPLVGDFDGNGFDDVFWYGPGSARDFIWSGGPSGFTGRSTRVNGRYRPVVGDFDADGADDILWYAPGSRREALWLGRSSGFRKNNPVDRVGGEYVPLAGSFDGTRGDDILWYGKGSRPDYRWSSGGDATFSSSRISVSGTYLPVVGDYDANGRDDILWYGPDGRDGLWYHGSNGGVQDEPTRVQDLGTRPVSGDFDDAAGDDLLFHRPGPALDQLWWTR